MAVELVAYRGFVRRWACLFQDPVFRKPRLWSNLVLKEICPHFEGRVLNCSGWADEDKFGGHYREYFPRATEYAVSNQKGGRQIGIWTELTDSIPLDLEEELPAELVKRYDVVLLHTVLAGCGKSAFCSKIEVVHKPVLSSEEGPKVGPYHCEGEPEGSFRIS